MTELHVDQALVGRKVRNAARPDWGDGTVLRVQPTQVGGRPACRVSIQFAAGHRTVVVPPCRLVEPAADPQRAAGWLDSLAGRTVDDRLRSLPLEVVQHLGTPRQRLDAVLPWYRYDDGPASLVRWARALLGVPDPLSSFSRDELAAAFAHFCVERDAHLRNVAAILVRSESRDALHQWLAALEPPVAAAVRAALSRVV